MRPIHTIPALIAIPCALAACGSQTHTATAPARHAASSAAHHTSGASQPAGASAAAASTTPAPSLGGSPSNVIARINDAFKHMTPQQRQALKARIPAYMHAMEQCAQANGGAQAATLACMQSHGFGAGAPPSP